MSSRIPNQPKPLEARNMHSRNGLRILGVCFAVVLWAVPMKAQVTTGTILGSVLDNSQAVVSGAQVTITEAGKGTSQKVVTDETGAYSAPFLIPGTYTVTVEMAG